ncbi:hypothetical protein [Streptomyces sp. NPDC102360]|uniref:hypothetical protein n=1 Tax=Streptomyces sp. NPDC102360 TaxID=3366160 RepID=UPI003805DD99
MIAFLGWLFLPVLEWRRMLIGVCLVVLLGCLGVVLLGRRGLSVGDGGESAAYSAVRPGRPADVRPELSAEGSPPGLPSALPVGRRVKVRGLVGIVGFLAAFAGILAVAAGDDTDAGRAADLTEVGAVRGSVRIVQVRELERFAGRSDTDFGAELTVMLPGREGEPGSRVALGARTHEEPHRGGKLNVLYAPGHPELGAVHGDSATLGRLQAGTALTPVATWAFFGGWAGVSLLVVLLSVFGGSFRGLDRLDGGARAVRGRVWGVARWDGGGTALRVRTVTGEVHFSAEQNNQAIAKSLRSEEVWVCWAAADGPAAKGLGERLRASLVGDGGWCLPGEVWSAQVARVARDSTIVGTPEAPVDPHRTVALWLPVTSWPLRLRGWSVLFIAVSVVATALLLTDMGGRPRWAAGCVAAVALLGACVGYLASGGARKGSPAVTGAATTAA